MSSGRAPVPNDGLDQICSLCDIHVLPDADHVPTVLHERSIHPTVALGVLGELRHPVVTVALGDLLMDRAAVPEAAVDEHGHLRSREDDVRSHTDASTPEQEILSEPKPAGMERRPHEELGLRVDAPIGLADLRRCRIARLWIRDDDAATQVDGSPFWLRLGRRCHRPPVYWGCGLTSRRRADDRHR
jgi:hypothetical protein